MCAIKQGRAVSPNRTYDEGRLWPPLRIAVPRRQARDDGNAQISGYRRQVSGTGPPDPEQTFGLITRTVVGLAQFPFFSPRAGRTSTCDETSGDLARVRVRDFS